MAYRKRLQLELIVAIGGLSGMSLSGGCAQEDPITDDLPLVRIEEHVISAGSLQRFEEALPDHAKSSAPDAQARREHLQSLVDRHLMGIEVQNRGLGATPGVQRDLAQQLTDKLVRDLLADSVHSMVHVTDEELRAAYEDEDLGWQAWPAHILSETEEEAREIVRALETGADFASLARERSLADDADRGGDLRGYFDPADIAPPARQAVLQLQAGQVSEPIQTAGGYEIIMVLAKRRLPFEQVAETIAKQVLKRKRDVRAAEFFALLKERSPVRYHGEQAHMVLRGLRLGDLRPDEEEAALVSYPGGVVWVGAFLESMRKLEARYRPTDSLAVFKAVDAWFLPDTLAMLLVRAEGRDRRGDVLAWKQAKHEELMFEQLYSDEVASRVSVEQKEVRRYYEQHIDAYTSLPGPIRLTEVLVDSEEEAREVLAAARAGDRLETLAQQHSRRPEVAPVGGHVYGDSGLLHIESLHQSPYRDALGDVNHEDVGKVLGPLRMEEGYSVFRLDAPIELTPIPYEQVRRPIRHRLRKKKEAVRFAAFIDSLRTQHAAQTRWFESNLALVGVAR